MSAPAITVGLPFRDEEARIGAAIASILAQEESRFELLLVDDGSQDRSLAIARSFSDPRIRLFTDGERKSLPARLNEIVAEARAPLVARMDADDVAHPSRLSRQLAAIDAHPEWDAVGSWIAVVDDDDRPCGVIEADPSVATRATAIARGVLPHATLLARTTWLRANPYDPEFSRAEDRDLWCRTISTSTFGVVPECLYVIRLSVRDPRFVGKYLESQRQNRILYARHGPAMVGLVRTARLWAGAHARGVAMRTCSFLGLTEWLVHRRGRAPTPNEAAMALEALAIAQRA